MLDEITPVILTFNEAPNIRRTLAHLSWAKEVVVIDSFSTDETAEIVSRFANARLMQRKFDTHTLQWNFGIQRPSISTEWVLAIDADYVVSEELVREIQSLAPEPEVVGYRASFRYCIEGQPLRAAVYPPVTVLYRRSGAEYLQDGHTQRVRLTGRIVDLNNPIFHDDRKSLVHWLNAQGRYMQLEAKKLHRSRIMELRVPDRVRKLIVVAPIVMFFYCMFVKGNMLDGRAGLFYALQRAVAEGILSLHLLQALLPRGSSDV